MSWLKQFTAIFAVWSVGFIGLTSFSCRENQVEKRSINNKESESVRGSLPSQTNQKEKSSINISGLQARANKQKELKEKKLSAIKEIDNPEDLKKFTTDLDCDIRSAVVARLGEIGTPEAVEMLGEVFNKEPRKRGTDVSYGIKGEAINALVRSGNKNALDILLQIIQDYLQEGPLVRGPYSHIYDPQYYSVLSLAVGGLNRYPSSETLTLLNSIADNSRLFYSLREKARETLFVIEMQKKGLNTPHNQVSYLLSQMRSDGVFPEKWWKEPGEKTDAAIKQSVIEKLIKQRGWDSVGPLLAYIKSTDYDDYAKQTAVFQILSDLLLQNLGESKKREDIGDQQIKVIERILYFLENITEKNSYSSAVTDIYKNVYSAADIIQSENIWDRIKRIHQKFEVSYNWEDKEPSETELGFSLPEGSVFIESLSSQVEFKSGKIQRICYFCDVSAGELVKHFEKAVGKEAVKQALISENGETNTLYLIEFGNVPKEIQGFIKFGVTIFETEKGFKEKLFGEVIKEGKTMFRITRFVY
jgi:hypothetical protein